jgi:hypothetical protein
VRSSRACNARLEWVIKRASKLSLSYALPETS